MSLSVTPTQFMIASSDKDSSTSTVSLFQWLTSLLWKKRGPLTSVIMCLFIFIFLFDKYPKQSTEYFYELKKILSFPLQVDMLLEKAPWQKKTSMSAGTGHRVCSQVFWVEPNSMKCQIQQSEHSSGKTAAGPGLQQDNSDHPTCASATLEQMLLY